MTEEQRGDIGEFIISMDAAAEQLVLYGKQLKGQTKTLSDVKGRKETSATLCAIEQALAQITESAKQIGKDRHNAALVLGMDELIATQHKTLDQFGEEEADKAAKDSKDSVKESGAEVEMRITSGASPVLAEAKRRLEEED